MTSSFVTYSNINILSVLNVVYAIAGTATSGSMVAFGLRKLYSNIQSGG